MGIIDFRLRPLYKHYNTGFDKDTVHKFHTAFGYEETASMFSRKQDLTDLFEEMDAAGIEKAVVPGRVTYGTTNEELIEILDLAPDRFIIYPFLDITNTEQALVDIDTFIINGKGQGASYEPLWGNDYKFDDERIDPIYKKLEENNIPLLANVSQLAGPIIDPTIPTQIDRVLNKYPNLVFIAAHSGWPWLTEMISLTFKHPNLYLTADFNGTRGAGADQLEYAAKYMAKDQIVFASCYPFAPIQGGIDSVKAWDIPEETTQKILHDTAAKILGL